MLLLNPKKSQIYAINYWNREYNEYKEKIMDIIKKYWKIIIFKSMGNWRNRIRMDEITR